MKNLISRVLIVCTILGASAAFGQIKQTKEQILFYTSEWKGERFPDGRPKVADNLLDARARRVDRRRLGVSARPGLHQPV